VNRDFEAMEIRIEGIADSSERRAQTRDLMRMIEESAPEVKIEEPTAPVTPGAITTVSKGDPLSLGLFAMSFITSGSLVAVVGAFKAFLSRDQNVTLKIKHGNRSVEISGKNVKESELQSLLASAAAHVDQ
jgi:hypothetical protein